MRRRIIVTISFALIILSSIVSCTQTPINNPPPVTPPILPNPSPQKPIAIFSVYPINPRIGDTVVLDASLSHSPNGEIVKYTWNLGATSDYVTIDYTDLSSKILVVKFTKVKVYLIKLTVTDNIRQSNTSTYNLEVYPLPSCH